MSAELAGALAVSLAHALGTDSETALAQAIRSGAFDDRMGELAEALWETTLDKLAVANPTDSEDSCLS